MAGGAGKQMVCSMASTMFTSPGVSWRLSLVVSSYTDFRAGASAALDGHHRPLCTKCVFCLLVPWGRIGFGIGAYYEEYLQLWRSKRSRPANNPSERMQPQGAVRQASRLLRRPARRQSTRAGPRPSFPDWSHRVPVDARAARSA